MATPTTSKTTGEAVRVAVIVERPIMATSTTAVAFLVDCRHRQKRVMRAQVVAC